MICKHNWLNLIIAGFAEVLLISVVVCGTACSASAKPKEIIKLEEAKADPDFSIQGEYVGQGVLTDGKSEKAGAQVIALGEGKFRVVVTRGGLPGDGWKRGDERFFMDGRREGDATTLQGRKLSGKIVERVLTIVDSDGKQKIKLERTERKSPTLGAKPPADAMVIFDGTNLDMFEHTEGHLTDEKTLLSGVTTKPTCESYTLHLEFCLSYIPTARGQARSNSGVYFHDCYEIQVLDSFGLDGKNNECGGFYSVKEPDVNMCLPPLVWQTYDVDFTAPKYKGGKKVTNARITVRHNGVMIHDDLELPHNTPARKKEGPGPRGLHLQGHGNKVQYRNVWIKKKCKPNIVYILADDLGYGELGCYGQEKIRTPNIDRLAAEGMRFSQHYCGAPVCAPSRCVLMTGMHLGHAYIRNNKEIKPEGQEPIPDETVTIAEILKDAGYATCAIGKWGLGPPSSQGDPNNQGFDHFFGYNCQRHAHNYYPTYLWRNDKRIKLNNPAFSAHERLPKDADPNDPAVYKRYAGNDYSPDRMIEEALWFIRENKDRPFFLYYPMPIPHLSIQVPEDSLAEYVGKWPDPPYVGDKGYVPHPAPRAGYAAMITRMDRDIGRMLALLKELGLEENTLVMFSSDNGPTFGRCGGSDSEFFNSAGPFSGLKGSVYEGGIRVPMIAQWPGKIKPHSTTDHISAFWDVMPTLAEAVGAKTPPGIDGISFLSTLLGTNEQKQHEFLLWEFYGYGGQQAVRMDNWKGIRVDCHKDPTGLVRLYNLKADIAEQHDIAADHPEIVQMMATIMQECRTESVIPQWNFQKFKKRH